MAVSDLPPDAVQTAQDHPVSELPPDAVQTPHDHPVAGSSGNEALRQTAIGFNEGLDALYNLPNYAVNAVAKTLGYEPPMHPVRLASKFNEPDAWRKIANDVSQGVGLNAPFKNVQPDVNEQPTTDVGRYARSVGQQLGASVVPSAGLMRAGLIPATGGALAQNASSIVGSGIGSQIAEDQGYGTLGKTLGAVAGGFAAVPAYNIAAKAAGVGKNAISYGRMAAEEGRNPQLGADRRLNEALGQAGTSAEELRDLALPKYPPQSNLPKRGFTQDHLAEMIGRNFDGEDFDSIARDFSARGLPISGKTIQAYVDRYNAKNPTPMTMMDYAEEAVGPGSALPLTRLARRSQIISGDAEPALRLFKRQVDQPARLTGMVDEVLPEKATAEQMHAAERAAQERAVNLIDQEYPAQNYEAGRKRLTEIAEAQHRTAYNQLHNQPDIVVDEGLAKLLATPKGKAAYDQAVESAAIEGKPIPSRSELVKMFGFHPNSGLGLNKEGIPTPAPRYPVGIEPPFPETEASLPSSYWNGSAPDQAQSLLAFIRSRGGIRPSGETKAMNAERIPGLVNSKGMPADKAREALVEAGYIREDPHAEPTTSVADFYDLLDRAVRGETITREGEAGLPYQGQAYAQSRMEAQRLEAMAREHLKEIGMDPAAFDKLPSAQRLEIAQRIERGSEEGRIQQDARLHFPESFDRLTPSERSELAHRIAAGEDPHDVYEELAIRAENNFSPREIAEAPDLNEIQPGFIMPARALDYLQRVLRRNGRDPSNPASSDFKTLRRRLIEHLDPENPSPENPTLLPNFRKTMQDYRASIGHQEALDLAATLEPKLNEKTYQTLAEFDKMTPVEQELFRLRFARKLQDTLNNAKFGSGALEDFDTPALGTIVRRVFPRETANRILTGVESERLTAQAPKFGEQLAEKLGSDPDPQELRIFNTLDDQQKELFKAGFSRGLRARIGRKAEGDEVAKQFNNENARQILGKVLSKQEAQDITRNIRREATSTKIKNAIYGNSNTAQTDYDISAEENAGKAIASMATLNPGRWLDSWYTALAKKVGAERATHIIRDMTELNPAEQLRTFERLMGTKPSPVDRDMLAILRGQKRPYGPGRGWMAGQTAETLKDVGNPPDGYPHARKGSDGRWYIPDSARPGKYLQVRP